jgi:hypothetical protein
MCEDDINAIVAAITEQMRADRDAREATLLSCKVISQAAVELDASRIPEHPKVALRFSELQAESAMTTEARIIYPSKIDAE